MNINLPILVIDGDIKVHEVQEKALNVAGYTVIRVDSMIEAISQAKNADFLFVGINADNIDYLPQLRILHDVANAPILIAKTDFTIDEHNKAIKNGAESFGTWAETPEKNLETTLTLVERFKRRTKRMDSKEVLVHKNLLISLKHRVAFIDTVELDITSTEFKILYYLVLNRGFKLSFEDIYGYAWGIGYEDSSHTLLWTLMTKLRGKITKASPNQVYIKTVRGYGYTIPT